MQRSTGLEETPSLPVKCTQTENKHSEHLMTGKQEGQSIAAVATGTVKSIPRSGFLILSFLQSIQQHFQLSRANNRL